VAEKSATEDRPTLIMETGPKIMRQDKKSDRLPQYDSKNLFKRRQQTAMKIKSCEIDTSPFSSAGVFGN
ncbi:hypothetical protein AKJ16_DCAP05047, partial [Drosera capensis]